MYSLGWPSFGSEEVQAVNRVISSNQLFADKEVSSFENAYSSYVKCKYALGVGNATQGLHLALAALSIGLGDEVVVPPYSWISTASCVLMQNAVPIGKGSMLAVLGLETVEIQNLIENLIKT